MGSVAGRKEDFLGIELKKHGFADLALESVGNGFATVADPLGLGYGDFVRQKLGDAVYEDAYIKGADEVTDAVSGFAQGAVRGAASTIPGAGKALSMIDSYNPMNSLLSDEQLYEGQDKIKQISKGAGKIGGAVVGGIATGNVVGAISGGLGGASDVMSGIDMNAAGEQRGTGWQDAAMYTQLGGQAVGIAGGFMGGSPNLSDSQMAFNSSFDFLSGMPKMEEGGAVPKSSPSNLRGLGTPKVYSGQKHSGPNGGIPVDNNGNPTTLSGKQPVALTEDGEVSWNGYVFSNRY